MRASHPGTAPRPPSATDTRSDQPSTGSLPATLDSRTFGGSQLSTDFRPPTPAARHDPDALYALLDHGATRSRREFENRIHEAQTQHGGRVTFTLVRDGGQAVGYILSSPTHVDHARAAVTLPVLMVTGGGDIDRHNPYFRAAPRIDLVQLSQESAADPLIAAGLLRREDPPVEIRRAGGQGATQQSNYRVDSARLDPMQTARFIGNAGRSAEHRCPVDVFLAPPGTDVYLATIQRAIRPDGTYARICYARA